MWLEQGCDMPQNLLKTEKVVKSDAWQPPWLFHRIDQYFYFIYTVLKICVPVITTFPLFLFLFVLFYNTFIYESSFKIFF